jgi:hypothetical protein
MIKLPAGQSRLPICEFAQNKATSPGTKIRPLTILSGPSLQYLDFDAWKLMHAAYKTTVLGCLSDSQSRNNALAYAYQNSWLFAWNPQNFRIRKGCARFYKDSHQSHFTSEIAEGISYLFMHERGYHYWDHLQTLIMRLKSEKKLRHHGSVRTAKLIKKFLSEKPDKRPDFIFEKSSKESALVESKGSFIVPNKRMPSITRNLTDALDQLKDWPNLISPKPKKSFAIATYLREEVDPPEKPSLIAFVDPEESSNKEPIIELGTEIRKGNYGSWLYAMGFDSAATSLLFGESSILNQYRLPVMKLGQHEFAIVPFSWWYSPPYTFFPFSSKNFWGWIKEGHQMPPVPWFWFEPEIRRFEIFGIGIEVKTFNAVTSALSSRQDRILFDLPTLNINQSDIARSETFSGSIFDDGTFLGVIHVNLDNPPDVEIRNFNL